MVLPETKNNLQSLNHLAIETRLPNMAEVDSDGASEGICLLRSNEVDIYIRFIFPFFLEFEVINVATCLLCLGFGIYTNSDVDIRSFQLEFIRQSNIL